MEKYNDIVFFDENGVLIALDPITTSWVAFDYRDQISSVDTYKTIYKIFKKQFNTTISHRKAPAFEDEIRDEIFVPLHVTSACNLSCEYCFAESKVSDEVMSPYVAKKIIQSILSIPKIKSATFLWTGGEPLLAPATILNSTKYGIKVARKLQKRVKFLIQTNATLLKKSVAKSLLDLGIGIGVSLDGPAYINDQLRKFCNGKSAYKAILNGIRNVFFLGGDLGVIITVTKINAPYIISVINHLLSLGFSEIKINNCHFIGRAKSRNITLSPLEFLNIKINAIKHMAREAGIIPSNTKKIIWNLLFHKKSRLCYSSPSCGVGTRILAFDANGDVYPCDEFITSQEMIMGNIFKDDVMDMFESSPTWKMIRSRTVENIAKCSKCIWRNFCGGGCAANAFFKSGTIFKEDPDCDYRRGIFRFLLRKLVTDQLFQNVALRNIGVDRKLFGIK